MKTVLKNAFLILLTLAVLFSSSGSFAHAADCTDQPEAITFSFLKTPSDGDLSTICYYTDECFYQPGTHQDSHLRTMSLSMAMSAFESYRDGDDYTGRCENFEDLMKKAGFSDLFHNEAFDRKPEDDTIGVAIASKKIDVRGTGYTLIAIGLRGAGYEAEWAGNFRVGESGPSAGFSSARDQVLDCLIRYEADHKIRDHAKIWIAGFSRAGAVSNLTGESLNLDPEAYATTTADIYCYTFEAPRCEEVSRAGQYPNIHNTVSPADPVPLIPLQEWDLTRVGYEQEGQEEPYIRDDLLLPAPGTAEYEANKSVMLERLSAINPDINYTIDSFSEVSFDIFNQSNHAGVSQSDYVRSFFTWINSTLPERSRASYTEHYQDAFSTLARFFAGAKGTQKDLTAAALKAAVRDPLLYADIAAVAFTIQLRNVMGEDEYEQSLRNYSRSIGENLTDHMKNEGLDFSEEEYESFKEAIYPVIRFADDAIEDDMANYGGAHLATLLFNVKPLIQAHCPEIILAWVQSYDSYFVPSLRQNHQTELVEEVPAGCTEPGHAAYWLCTNCGAVYADRSATNKITYDQTLLPAKGHSWDDGKVTKEATPYTNGLFTYTCTVCGRTRTETIKKLPMPEETITDDAPPVPEITQEPASEENSSPLLHGAGGFLLFVIIFCAAIAVLLYYLHWKKKKEPDS